MKRIYLIIALMLLVTNANSQSYSYKCERFNIGKGKTVRKCSYIPIYKPYELAKQEKIKGKKNKSYQERQYTSYFKKNRYRKYKPNRPMIEN